MLILSLFLALAACSSSGADAPAVGEPAEACNEAFCVAYPAGWDVVDTGESYISFRYPGDEGILATVGRVSLEGITVNAGGTWPAPPREVVDLLWSLLDGGDAELSRVDLADDGSFDSSGFASGGRLWHRLVPVTASRGYGIEMRAPNASWEPHADVFRQSLVILDFDP